ncbi:MAG: type II toxin-antitoxin system HicB family antitoxin [Coprothermobacterota bacterium]|nr:type II toxin-antitoxin system HicB family antitoxin [Coprothermobacterota bacterium]
MHTEYTVIVKQKGDWWIGWIGEVLGVNCQERSRQELLESLRATLQEAIEFNRKDAIASAGSEYSEERIVVSA